MQADMSSLQCSIPGFVPAGSHLLTRATCGLAIFSPPSLFVALLVALAGCASTDRSPEPTPPLVEIPESTWWRVDADIGPASLAAPGQAGKYGRGEMEDWRSYVQARTDADFIPWFTGYWTQQWLAIKVAWYRLGAEEGTDPAVNRLASYLQEEYDERVLDPVAKNINPDAVREEATMLYIRVLGEQLPGIRRRHGVPQAQFDRRHKDIPAIALPPPPVHGASLYEVVRAGPIESLPAYVALTAGLSKEAEGAGPSDTRLSPVAKRVSENMLARLGPGIGASAAAAAVGGVAGMAISLGVAGIGAIAYEKERPEIEAQLRNSLDAALGEMWRSLVEDPAGGVMAGVHHISGQITDGLARTFAQPVQLEPLPQEISLPGDKAPEDEDKDRTDEGAPDNN